MRGTTRRVLIATVLAAVGLMGAAGVTAASASSVRASSHNLNFEVRLIQEVTYQYPNGSPLLPGSTGQRVLSTTLRLYAVGSVLGFPNNQFLGTMSFTYELHGSCSASVAGCSGTTDLVTTTYFPGGTIKAGGPKINLAQGLIVPVSGGTGIFKGVSGSIDIAPGDQPESIYNLVLPSSAT